MVLTTSAAGSQLIRILRSQTKTSTRLLNTLPKVASAATCPLPLSNNTNTAFSSSNTTATTARGLVTSTQPMSMGATAGQTLAQLASDNPHVEVIRYEHKNVKWTMRHVEYFADCLAVGLLENGLKPGDAMLSWLPSHFSEQHILQFACSKAGFVLYNLDPSLAITDPAAAKTALSKALELSEATCLFTQEAGDDVNYTQLVKEVIPEIRIFGFESGMPFFTPRFPNLRFPIHTGFDQWEKEGMLPLKHMLVPSGELNNLLDASGEKLDGKTPLLGEFALDKSGIPEKKGKTLSNDEVLKGNVFPQVSSILSKQYTEVKGVGVVF